MGNANQIKMNRLLDYFAKVERSYEPIRSRPGSLANYQICTC